MSTIIWDTYQNTFGRITLLEYPDLHYQSDQVHVIGAYGRDSFLVHCSGLAKENNQSLLALVRADNQSHTVSFLQLPDRSLPILDYHGGITDNQNKTILLTPQQVRQFSSSPPWTRYISGKSGDIIKDPSAQQYTGPEEKFTSPPKPPPKSFPQNKEKSA